MAGTGVTNRAHLPSKPARPFDVREQLSKVSKAKTSRPGLQAHVPIGYLTCEWGRILLAVATELRSVAELDLSSILTFSP